MRLALGLGVLGQPPDLVDRLLGDLVLAPPTGADLGELRLASLQGDIIRAMRTVRMNCMVLAILLLRMILLCDCGRSTPQATVSGTLQRAGPAAVAQTPVPISGAIRFDGSRVYLVRVLSNGRYRVAVIPG